MGTFDMNQLPERLFARIETLVLGVEVPAFLDAKGHPWSRAILEMREKRPTYGFPRDALQNAFLLLFATMGGSFMKEHERFEREWHDKVPRMRMLCITEEHDNLLMWAHYAQNHTGAVLEFRVMPEEDIHVFANALG